METNEILYNWILHYNHHKLEWSAFRRENHARYWNGELTEDEMYSHANVNELIKILSTCT